MTRGRIRAGAGVAAVEISENSKLTIAPWRRAVSATYVAQASCPVSCAFMGSGCYAELGPTGRVTRRLAAESAAELAQGRALLGGPDAVTADDEAYALAVREAAAIDELSGGMGGEHRPLRLRVVGDCRTDAAARVVGAAAGRYKARGGGDVWCYTHAWRDVARASWGPDVSVMASCETDRDVAEAQARGYVPALVRDFGAARPSGGITCPQQTGQLPDCASCMACARSERLMRGGRYIVLAPHGPSGKPTKAMRAYLDGVEAEGGSTGPLGASGAESEGALGAASGGSR